VVLLIYWLPAKYLINSAATGMGHSFLLNIMAKDPAFLFYPGDWLMGTLGMTLEEKGCYMELLVMQFNKGKFSIQQAKRTLNGCFDSVWPTLVHKFVCEGDLYYNVRLQAEKDKRGKFTESRRNSRLKSDEDSVKLYLIYDKDTRYFKIGSSVNPLRRFAEMVNQKNPAITVGERNYELFWVSEIVKRTAEKEVHIFLKSKRITGEWFSLNDTDIKYIKSAYGGVTYDGTYESRTEDENINKDTVLNNKLKSEKKKFNTMPTPADFNGLPEIYYEKSIEFVKLTKQVDIDSVIVKGMWEVFKVQKLTGQQYYSNEGKVYSYFLDWLKYQKFENGTNKQPTGANRFTDGQEKLLARGKQVFADITRKQNY